MTRFQRLASAASLIACMGLGTAAVAHANPEQPTAGHEGRDGHGRHGHHGRGDLLRASLKLDSLTAAQRQQIEGLVQGEKAAHANVAAARGQLLQAVADRVAAGSVDDSALAPKVQAVEAAIQADEPGDRAALEKLHAVLTPAQRIELVTRIESHAGHERRGEQGKPDQRRADGGPQAEGRERGEHGWGRELNLSDAQKEQIKVNMRSAGPQVDESVRKQAKESQAHVLEAFKGDRFVMSEVAPPKDPRLVSQGAERIVRMAKAAAPVLTAEQRATAAAKLREEATRVAK